MILKPKKSLCFISVCRAVSHNHFQGYLTTTGVLSQQKRIICGPTENNNFHTFLEMKVGRTKSNSFAIEHFKFWNLINNEKNFNKFSLVIKD